jgi:hypothetical protein
VKFQVTGSGAHVVEALWAKDLASANGADLTYQTKLLDFLVSNPLPKQSKPFPLPTNGLA